MTVALSGRQPEATPGLTASAGSVSQPLLREEAACRPLSAMSPELGREFARAHRAWAERHAPWLLEEWLSA